MTSTEELRVLLAVDPKGVCVGHIAYINAQGRALVDFPGNHGGPVKARFAMRPTSVLSEVLALNNARVLLAFENGDSALPVIIGAIYDDLFVFEREAEKIAIAQRPEIFVDGKKLILEAKEEILLRCGESSLSLKRDGKIVVKGSRIVSRASRTNKIRGASVAIN